MTHSNFQTNNKFGLPLKAPSKQTILPVFCGGNGNLQGFYPIAVTTFDGTETQFSIEGTQVAIISVTLPPKVDDGTGFGVQQFMAVVYDDSLVRTRPWIGFSSFVADDEVGYLGARHVMPTQGWHTDYFLGILVTNLLVNMATDSFTPDVPVPPVVSNGTIRWVASMEANQINLECAFFDFLWPDLFKAKSERTPLMIEVVSNPPGGFFKSTLVPNPVVTQLGGIMFNTVRIIRLNPAPAGTYTFTYKVTDDQAQSTTCQLVLTLV